jgi:hypothetical protein
MRTAFLLIIALLALPGCQPLHEGPTKLTGLPRPTVTLVSSLLRRDLVRLVWSVSNPAGRKFEFQRQNRAEPWKHFATVEPADGRLTLEDTGVVPGLRYLYRLRISGTKGDDFLDEVEVDVPLN